MPRIFLGSTTLAAVKTALDTAERLGHSVIFYAHKIGTATMTQEDFRSYMREIALRRDQMNYVTPSTYREMYVGVKWRTNPAFIGKTGAGNKLMFLRGPVSNGVLMMYGRGTIEARLTDKRRTG